ncbi:MAG: NERD domain-containing protein [Candidatus Yanofskybacteria bacterium]|nr:NERD domain-containing protein [Candidatus Yanofskybacteria bacterium]
MKNIIYLIIWFTFLAFIVQWVKYKFPHWKGWFGERFVHKKLSELGEMYKIIDDLLLPSAGNINTTQIDHVIVSNYGIFCIETKDYSGWIFGNARDQYWTQVIYRRKHRFYNPLRQNYAHIMAIEDLIKLQFPNIKIFPFIIFPSAGKLKITGTDCVGNGRDTVAKIRTFNREILTDTDRDKIYEILVNADIKDKESRKLHIKNAKSMKIK